jgi:hypothetical protein
MPNSDYNSVYLYRQARRILPRQHHLSLFLVLVLLLLSVPSTAAAAGSFSSFSRQPSEASNVSASSSSSPVLQVTAAATSPPLASTKHDKYTSEEHPHQPHPALERGKFLQYPFEADQVYRVYKELQQDYRSKAFLNDNSNDDNSSNNHWKTLVDRGDVQVAIMPHTSDPTCPYVRMQAVIPVSVERCWDFLSVSNWARNMPKIDPFYEGVSVHGEFEYEDNGVHMLLCRRRTKRWLAFGKRDLSFLSVTDEPLEDGTWVSGSVSVVTDKVPRVKGYCRAFQDSIAYYKPLKNNTETAVTIVCRIDLNDSAAGGDGGHIPMWLYVKTIGITGAKSIMNMKRALMQEQEDRNANKIQEQPAMEELSLV